MDPNKGSMQSGFINSSYEPYSNKQYPPQNGVAAGSPSSCKKTNCSDSTSVHISSVKQPKTGMQLKRIESMVDATGYGILKKF